MLGLPDRRPGDDCRQSSIRDGLVARGKSDLSLPAQLSLALRRPTRRWPRERQQGRRGGRSNPIWLRGPYPVPVIERQDAGRVDSNAHVVSGVEAAIFGPRGIRQVDEWIDQTLQEAVGSGLQEVIFRSGRIDAVYGVRTADDRRLLLKVHRPPADLRSRRLTSMAQHLLASSGFPCGTPVAGPALIGQWVISVETLLERGHRDDAHRPAIRKAIAEALAEQMRVLRDVPGVGQATDAPAWCLYHDGPWPRPHDTIFDFQHTPHGWEWLDNLASKASAAIAQGRDDDGLVAAHADFNCGNLRFDDDHLAACFDWDLVVLGHQVVSRLTGGSPPSALWRRSVL